MNLVTHYASNQLLFNLENLSSGLIGPRDTKMLCLDFSHDERCEYYCIATNDEEIIKLITEYFMENELLPVEGFLGGFNIPRDEMNNYEDISDDSVSDDSGCLIFKIESRYYEEIKKIIEENIKESLV